MEQKQHLPLTEAEQKVLNAIMKYKEKQGYMPTRQELADAVGGTRQLIQQSLVNMQNKGYLVLRKGGWRNITLL